jgi:hypothetical protein
MYGRLAILALDPALLGTAIGYLEETVQPQVEAQDGSRGLACMVNADLGICLFASYWDTRDAMAWSEQTVQESRVEVLRRLFSTATVEHYEVPVFVRRRRAQDNGAGVRINRIDCAPAAIDAAVEQFRRTAVPVLLDTPALCSVQIATDRTTGRGIVATAWETIEAMGASRSAVARLRATMAAMTGAQVRSVEEYTMVFSSVRDGIALEAGVWVSVLDRYDDRSGAQRGLSGRTSYWVL